MNHVTFSLLRSFNNMGPDPREKSFCHLPTVTIAVLAGCSLRCLWVPLRLTRRHTRSSYRLLYSAPDMLLLANPSPSPLCVVTALSPRTQIRYYSTK